MKTIEVKDFTWEGDKEENLSVALGSKMKVYDNDYKQSQTHYLERRQVKRRAPFKGQDDSRDWQLHNAWGNIDVEPIGQIQLSRDNINHNTYT